MERNIWSLGFQAANNPSIGKQILHSKTIHGLKRSFEKKSGYGKLAVTVVSKATSFIPVPYAADVINKGIAIASDKIRAYAISKKKGAADSTDPSLEKLVKFSIKELDISDLDRYRLKIKEAQEDFQKATNGFGASLGKHMATEDVCTAFFEVAEKRGYLVRRLIKMRASTLALREILDQIDKCCAGVEKGLNQWQNANSKAWRAMLESYPESVYTNCGDTICVIRSGAGPSGPGAFGQGLCTLTSAAVSFVSLDEVVNYGADQGLGQI